MTTHDTGSINPLGHSETIREEVANTLLAQLLRDSGVPARAERRSRNGVPDIRVTLKSGDTILVECKWVFSRSQLESQLSERLLQFPEALGLIGVLYPDRLKYVEDTRAELEVATDIRWWLHGSRGETVQGSNSRTGSVVDLADQLRMLPLELEGADRVSAAANVVGYGLEQAAKEVSRHSRLSRRVADIIAKTDQEKNRAAALRIGCLVLFNALAFQDRLSASNENVPTVVESIRAGRNGLRGNFATPIPRLTRRTLTNVLTESVIGPNA